MTATCGTGPAGESTKPLTKGKMAYPARSCSPDRGSVLGPQQTPASTSGGGTKGIEQDGGSADFDKLERGWNDWVIIVKRPVRSAANLRIAFPFCWGGLFFVGRIPDFVLRQSK
jgi:hypothetical protein